MIILDNLGALVFTCLVTVIYLGAVGICRTVLFSTILKIDDNVINIASFGIFSLMFFLGPFVLPFFHKIISKITYKAVFFITSVANVLSMSLYVFVVEQQPADGYLITLILLFEAIASPFMAIFYCAFNYYIRGMAVKENTGVFFGIGYSIFYMQSFIGDIYIAFGQKIYQYNQYFYYPMLGISLLITLLYWFIQEPSLRSQSGTAQSINLEEKIQAHLYGSLMDDQNNINTQLDLSYGNQIKQIWTVSSKLPGLKYIIPTMIQTGMLTAFSVECSQSMIELNYTGLQLQPKIIRSMAAHGAGQFLGGIMIGFLSDVYGQISLLIWLQLVGAITFVLSVIYYIIKGNW